MSSAAVQSDPDRVLTFLCMLDDDVIEHTLRQLTPEMAARLKELLADGAAHRPSVRAQKAVLGEFARFFSFAVKYSKPVLKLHEAPPEETQYPQYEPTDDSIKDLQRMNVAQVTTALEEETPRTAAIMLKEMPHARAAEILTMMRDDYRQYVVTELSLNPTAPPVVLRQIAQTLVSQANSLPPERETQITPAERMAEIMRATDKKLQLDMLRTLKSQNEELSAEVQKLLFRFEDLPELTDAQLRNVLNKIETSVLALALFEAEKAITEKVYSNLSRRARETLQEELNFLSNVPDSQLESSRESVGAAIAEVVMEEG